MTQERSSVYRGETREMAEVAYHADARVMANMGFAPKSEDWSSVREEVLTVRYVYAPELGSAVLEALSKAEKGRPVPRRLRLWSAMQTVLQRIESLYDRQTPEMKLWVGATLGSTVGIALWWFLGRLVLGDNPLMLFASVFASGLVGLFVGSPGVGRST